MQLPVLPKPKPKESLLALFIDLIGEEKRLLTWGKEALSMLENPGNVAVSVKSSSRVPKRGFPTASQSFSRRWALALLIISSWKAETIQ